MAIFSGARESGAAKPVAGLDIRTLVEEHFHHFGVSLSRGSLQRREAITVRRVNVRPMVK